jgi:5'-nucleotidase
MTGRGQEWQVYAGGGSPAQAFLHGYYEVLGFKPDLVVSGINYGENVASGVTISGTVGAALEAATFGIPALAVSLQTPVQRHLDLSPEVDFSATAYFTHYFAERMLRLELPFDVSVLKVDVPHDATPQTPWVVTRQSRLRYYFPMPVETDETDGARRISYTINLDEGTPEEDSDLHAVIIDHKVSVTPLSFDLTSRVDLDELGKLIS